MSKRHVSVILSLLLLLCATSAIAKSHVPKSNTRAAIKAYVKSAANVVAKNGPSCETFKSKDWMAGDYYISVSGPDDRVICHPTASMIGKSMADIVDANGKKVGLELKVAAEKKGGGWVSYVWPRPGQTTPVPKTSYAMRVKGPDGKWYRLTGGGYELK